MSIFVAIDVETANPARHSICQIGLVAFAHGKVLWEWSSIVDPRESFDRRNVDIHGISLADVRGAPSLDELWASISPSLSNQLIACYSRFDCDALSQAAEKYNLELPHCGWIDASALAKVAWPRWDSFDLQKVCERLGIPLFHHDAKSDARACGKIVVRAAQELDKSVHELADEHGLLSAVPLSSASRNFKIYPTEIEVKGQVDGPLKGHVVVFTGEIEFGEAKLADIAGQLGCDVDENFRRKRTTILVTGTRDPNDFGGKQKSKKLLDAEDAIRDGRAIQILSELQFIELLRSFRGIL